MPLRGLVIGRLRWPRLEGIAQDGGDDIPHFANANSGEAPINMTPPERPTLEGLSRENSMLLSEDGSSSSSSVIDASVKQDFSSTTNSGGVSRSVASLGGDLRLQDKEPIAVRASGTSGASALRHLGGTGLQSEDGASSSYPAEGGRWSQGRGKTGNDRSIEQPHFLGKTLLHSFDV